MVSLSAAMVLVALSGTGQSVLLDFYSDSCGPCRMMDPVVKQLAAQGYPVRQVNIQQDPALAARFGVTRIPCFVMLVDGREVERLEGLTSGQRLVQMLGRAGASNAPASPPVVALNSLPAPPMGSGPAYCAVAGESQAGGMPVMMAPPAASGPARSDDDLLSYSARLRVEDGNGWSCGSGTLIDARDGWALILTCGHLFRDSKGTGRIEVDLFGANAAEKLPGELVDADWNDGHPDIGLVRVRVPRPLVVAHVAPPGFLTRPGDAIATVGCDNGQPPTVRHSRVTNIGKFLGAANVEVADLPVLGRSGGGLFTPDGQVIGVCNAADPQGHEGLYAALAVVQSELDRAGQSQVYRMPAPATEGVALAANSRVLQPLLRDPPAPAAALAAAAAPLKPEEQAVLDEVHKRQKDGAEVIFIVRPRKNPQQPCEVMMLQQASAAFLQRLEAETHPDANTRAQAITTDAPLQNTSLEVPRDQPAPLPRMVVLPQ